MGKVNGMYRFDSLVNFIDFNFCMELDVCRGVLLFFVLLFWK